MKQSFWQSPLTRSSVPKDKVTTPETLLGYLIGPFGALLSSGIFTSYLQVYLGEALGLSSAYLSILQLVSTFLIVAANLIVGQLIERTRTMAGKARPWLLLSALTLSVASVLMFIMPFEGTARYVWIAIAYNLYYAVAYPIYNTANATMVPVSTRDSEKRSVLASMSNFAGLGVMGAGSMVFPVLVTIVGAFIVFYFSRNLPYSNIVRQFYLIMVIMLSGFMIVTIRWKISMHMTAIGALCGFVFILGMKYLGDVINLLPLLILVASARLYLKQHTPAQVYVGYIYGATAVVAIMY